MTTIEIDRLLADYRACGRRPLAARRLRFAGVDGRDVYNISAPFAAPGSGSGSGSALGAGAAGLLLAGRVEDRADERAEVVLFTSDTDGVWRPRPGAARHALQDPFAFRHAGVLHLGGVEIADVDGPDGQPTLDYRTVVLRLADPAAPEQVFAGPWGMKDLRFADLPDGRLAVLTRPQGGADGRGRIGVTVVASLAALTLDDIATAPRLAHLFLPEEWGGVNQATLLPDGTLGLLAHIARFDVAGSRHYYPIAFELDPDTLRHTAPRILFERRDLPPGPAKRPDLADVIFPGALVPGSGGSGSGVTVFCGVGDAEAFEVDLDAVFGG